MAHLPLVLFILWGVSCVFDVPLNSFQSTTSAFAMVKQDDLDRMMGMRKLEDEGLAFRLTKGKKHIRS
jgi:hypothetical protein